MAELDAKMKKTHFTVQEGFYVIGSLAGELYFKASETLNKKDSSSTDELSFSDVFLRSDCVLLMSWFDDPAFSNDWIRTYSRYFKKNDYKKLLDVVVNEDQLLELFIDFVYYKIAKFDFNCSPCFVFFEGLTNKNSKNFPEARKLWNDIVSYVKETKNASVSNVFFEPSEEHFYLAPELSLQEKERANSYISTTCKKNLYLNS